jgi:PAS domain S-box-containing protein
MSIAKKVVAPIIGMVIIGLIITTFVTIGKARQLVIDEAATGTMRGYRDTVLNALTTMMISGALKKSKTSFLEQMRSIADVRVIRAESLDKDFGKGGSDDYAKTEIEKEVITKGVEKIELEGEFLSGVFPYIAKSNFMGKNCLNCHNVKEGTVLGAVSIRIPLAESFAHIRSLRNIYIGFGLIGILTVTGLIIVIVSVLRITTEDLNNLLASTSISTIFMSPDFRVKRYTPSATKLLNLVPSDIGRPLNDITHKFFDNAFFDDAENVLRNMIPLSKEVMSHDGKWFIRQIHPYHTQENKIEGVVVTFTEVTELKNAQQRALEQSGELNALINAMPAGVLISHDPECIRMTCNPAGMEIIGVTKELNLAPNASDDEGPRLEIRRGGVPISLEQLPMQVACVTGEPVMGDEIEIIHSDGVARRYYGNAVPLFGSHGAVRGSVGVLLDITELRQAQDKIAGLAAIVDSSADAIIGATLEGIIVSWNHGAEKLYGYPDKEAIGRSLTLLAPPDHPDEIPALLEKIRRGETIAAYYTLRMRKDGTLLDVSLTLSPIKDSTDKIIGASTVARDITDHKKYEEMIKRYSKKLERSNRELDNFASIAAHDLGAPLRAISGFAGLLQKRYKEKLGADADKYISNIVEGAGRMQQLIHDLLQYARAGTRDRPLIPVDVNTTVEKTLANLMFEIKESRAAITVDPLPTVFADSTQLIQLFQNLVGNAIKYSSDTPRIHISAERKDREWLFRVSDNGIGIDPRQFDRIFQIFQRLHTSEEYTGTGIGLATCKKIVERLGGHIWVESKPDEGSTFFFSLPLTES